MKTNQMNLFKYIAGLNLLVAPFAFAQTGDRGGNGGDVIVCKDGSVRMLDSLETENKRPDSYPLDLGAPTLSVREKVKIAISRVQAKDGFLAKEINERSNQLLDDIEAFESDHNPTQANTQFTTAELVNVPDEGMASIPVGCTIQQLIIQSQNPLPGQKKFLFQSNLWARMNSDQKATAITHESVYGYLISKNAASSPVTRFFNGLIISNEMERMSHREYFKLFDQLKIPYAEETVFTPSYAKNEVIHTSYVEFNGYPLLRDQISYDQDGNISSGAPTYEYDRESSSRDDLFKKLAKWTRNKGDPSFLFSQGKIIGIQLRHCFFSVNTLGYYDMTLKQLSAKEIQYFEDPIFTLLRDGHTFKITGKISKYVRNPRINEGFSREVFGQAQATYDLETGRQISFEMIP